jgi:3D (Asp-Asp-Asp) domain-containing protein/peptidoglycan hydrolase CwlO-like protein
VATFASHSNLVGCATVRAAARRHARLARLAAGVLAATATLLGATGAHADQQGQTARDAQSLSDAGDRLAAGAQAVTLELYALESELAAARERLASLRARAAEVGERREAARERLELVRTALATAEERLAARLRELYVRGDPDPLAVLLGADSLDDALTTLDSLGRFADQDRTVLEQVRDARAEAKKALDELAARQAELDALVADAAGTEAALTDSLEGRRAYLAELRAEQRLNAAQLARAEEQAVAAQEKADEIGGPPPALGPVSGSGSGMQLTVEVTAYSLPGTTATGIPVGWGVVAVDPSVIPLGTRMTIPGYGEGIAADTGGAVRGRVIDVWMPTREQALAWGRRTLTITLH